MLISCHDGIHELYTGIWAIHEIVYAFVNLCYRVESQVF
jgi:hypothetical protein